jgi:hypothetical protein
MPGPWPAGCTSQPDVLLASARIYQRVYGARHDCAATASRHRGWHVGAGQHSIGKYRWIGVHVCMPSWAASPSSSDAHAASGQPSCKALRWACSGLQVFHALWTLRWGHACILLARSSPLLLPSTKCWAWGPPPLLAGKYLVNDVLKAKCDAPIRVEVIDRTTGQPVTEDLPDVSLEVGGARLPACLLACLPALGCCTALCIVRACRRKLQFRSD